LLKGRGNDKAEVVKKLSFVQVSDTHLGASSDYLYRECNPAKNLAAVVDSINRLPEQPDFFIHTGDVCGDKHNEAQPKSYLIAEEILNRLNLPRYFVAGNHDNPGLMKSALQMAKQDTLLEDNNILCYKFEAEGVSALVLDARIEGKLQGHLSEGQIEVFEQELRKAKSPCLIFLHYPPVEVGSKWMDVEMLLNNRNNFEEVLLRYKSKVRGVFFGHVHQSLQIVKNEILYVSAPSTLFQFSLASSGRPLDLDPEAACGYNLVTIGDEGTKVNTRVICVQS